MGPLELMRRYQRLVVSTSWENCRYLIELLEENLHQDLQDSEKYYSIDVEEIKKSDGNGLSTASRDCFRFMRPLRVSFMNSLFCVFFAQFERQLVWLRGIARENHSGESSIEDSESTSIHGSKCFLEKLGIQFPRRSLEWEEIQNQYREIRNKLMHAGGAVSSEWGNWKYAEKEGILDHNTNQLALTRIYCTTAAINFEQFTLRVSESTISDAGRRMKRGYKSD